MRTRIEETDTSKPIIHDGRITQLFLTTTTPTSYGPMSSQQSNLEKLMESFIATQAPRKSNLETIMENFVAMKNCQNEDLREQNLHNNEVLRKLTNMASPSQLTIRHWRSKSPSLHSIL